MARTGLAAVLFVLLCAGTAQARFESLPLPPGGSDRIAGFAASGNTWVALSGQFPVAAFVSRDSGRTWQPAPFNGLQNPSADGPISVGPDRAFYAPVHHDGGVALARLAAGASAFERVPLAIQSDFSTRLGAPVFDDQGRMWLGFGDRAGSAVVRIAPDGSVAEQPALPAEKSGQPELRFVAGRLYARVGGDVLQLRGGTWRTISGFAILGGFDQWPLFLAGKTLVTQQGLSFDGGETFAARFQRVQGVEGTEKLLVEGGRVMTRFGTDFYRPSGLLTPDATLSLWQTQAGLLAAGVAELSLHRGVIPGLGVSSRGISAAGRAMIKRANFYRRQAGLPPVVGDRLISRASHNHAKYWAPQVGRGLFGRRIDAHSESRGTRGFTGQSPQDRCKHVGADCTGEVINFGNQATRPVDSWVATPFHRAPIIDPNTVVVGAARVGRVGVMNFAPLQGISLRSVGFPIGRYRGDLRFPGNETPDPTAICRSFRQPIPNVGSSIPVTFTPPVTFFSDQSGKSDAGVIEVAVFRGKSRVPGCTKAGFFMGRRPLLPHTRYGVKVRWRPTAGGGIQTTSWSFRTP